MRLVDSPGPRARHKEARVKNRRRVGIGLGLALASVALSACAGVDQAGAAVVWDSGRITEDQLAEQVAVISAVDGVEVSPQVTNEVVNFMAQGVLVNEAADQLGLSVTPGDVERATAEAIASNGGEEQLAAALAESDAEFEDFTALVESLVKRDLLLEQIIGEIDPAGAELALSPAVLDYLVATSVAMDLNTNPRFGVWDPASLAAQLTPNLLSRPGDNAVQALPEGMILPGAN